MNIGALMDALPYTKPPPDWPDVGYDVSPVIDGQQAVRVSTRTTRPVTPDFAVFSVGPAGDVSLLKADALARMMRAYKRAHPDGCPGSH